MRWLTFRQAARRVSRSLRTLHYWRADGMHTELDHRGRRIVEERTLLAMYRHKLQANPIHQQRAMPEVDVEPGSRAAYTRTREETLPARVHAPALADLPSPEVVLDRILDYDSHFGVS